MLRLTLLSLLVALTRATTCVDYGGSCRDDSNQCEGSYLSGKCAGPRNIRCCLNKTIAISTTSCPNVEVLSRDTWGAASPRSRAQINSAVDYFFIHHTDTPTCSDLITCSRLLRSIQRYHMITRKYVDIGYSFLVGGDGRVYEGRGWGIVGAHTLHYNMVSYAASFMGSFMSHLPTEQAMEAAKSLINCGVKEGLLKNDYDLLGHRDVSSTTSCPGDALYKEIRTWPHYNYTRTSQLFKQNLIQFLP